MPLVYGPDGKLYSDWRTENAAVKTTTAQVVKRDPPPPRPAYAVPIKAPAREQFGTPSREGITVAQADLDRFRADYTNPRGTSRFSDLLGAASSSLGRAESERVRQASEQASRRGYVGGFSGESDRARRALEQGRARIGFDAANQIATDSAGLFEGAAGRFASLVTAYNEQLGAGDRAYGSALEDTRARRVAAQEAFRGAQEGSRQFDTGTDERRREFDTTTGERRREFDIGEASDTREFDITASDRRREFDASHKLDRDKLEAALRDGDIDRALQLAEALGLDPRLFLPSGYRSRRGGGGSSSGSRSYAGGGGGSGSRAVGGSSG